jgi:thiamine phosphate synthase YjbQ (UPF0047 family)
MTTAMSTITVESVCHLFTPHTTCALTILTNEGGIAEDHDRADHVRAHVLSALVGPSVSVPVRGGRLGLGQFQRIVLVELEGPRARTIEVDGPR